MGILMMDSMGWPYDSFDYHGTTQRQYTEITTSLKKCSSLTLMVEERRCFEDTFIKADVLTVFMKLLISTGVVC